VEAVFGSQSAYAQAMIDDYKRPAFLPEKCSRSLQQGRHPVLDQERSGFRQAGGVSGRREFPERAAQRSGAEGLCQPGHQDRRAADVALLAVDNGKIVPSQYTRDAKAAGLDIITWTLERSGRIVEECCLPRARPALVLFQTTLDALHNDGDLMTTLDVLARQVGILVSSPTGRAPSAITRAAWV